MHRCKLGSVKSVGEHYSPYNQSVIVYNKWIQTLQNYYVSDTNNIFNIIMCNVSNTVVFN